MKLKCSASGEGFLFESLFDPNFFIKVPNGDCGLSGVGQTV